MAWVSSCPTDGEGWRKGTILWSVPALGCDLGDGTISSFIPELSPALDCCGRCLPRGLNGSYRPFPRTRGWFCCSLPLLLVVASPERSSCLLESLGNRCQLAGLAPWVSSEPHLPCNSFSFQFGDLTSLSPTLLDKGTSSPSGEVLPPRAEFLGRGKLVQALPPCPLGKKNLFPSECHSHAEPCPLQMTLVTWATRWTRTPGAWGSRW